MNKRMNNIWGRLLKYFGQGLLFVVPVFVTIAVLVYLFQKADTIFSTLMGDDVAPRKKFIQSHATLAELDI